MMKLSRFKYQGINALGDKITEVIDAPSLAIAHVLLHKEGIQVLKLVKKRRSWFNQLKVTRSTVCLFFRQLATMVESGIPLVQALDLVSVNQSNSDLGDLIHLLKKDIETGLSLSGALAKHPLHFNELIYKLVNIGELTGSLVVMLDAIATYKEKIEQINKKIKKALTYPLAIVFISLVLTITLLVFVVPQFEALFKEFGASLPWITATVVSLSNNLLTWWAMYVFLGFLSCFSYIQLKKKWFVFSPKVFLLKIPYLGSVFRKSIIARFARTLVITLNAGLPLMDSLTLIEAASGHIDYAKAVKHMRQEISKGVAIHTAMEKTKAFPHLVIQMVHIGEESGTLEKMLDKIADFYEEEVDNALEIINHLLEPAIMAILGLLVGGLVIAMYLPIFKLGSII